MKAMIFAAGMGTRLKPLTDTTPKALVSICDKPLLAHVLDKLEAEGVDSFVVNVHHFAEQIKKYLEDNKEKYPNVAISDESEELLETGGGIRKAEKMLKGDSFLVHNVDILSNLDVKDFIEHEHANALATLLVSERETSRYLLFDDDMRLVGWTNVSTGEVRSADPDIDPTKCHKYAFSGIHIISDEIFDAFRDIDQIPEFYPIWQWKDGHGPIMTGGEHLGERFPIMDFYLRASEEYPIYGVVYDNLKLIDVGKFDHLSEAEELCKTLSEEGTL